MADETTNNTDSAGNRKRCFHSVEHMNCRLLCMACPCMGCNKKIYTGWQPSDCKTGYIFKLSACGQAFWCSVIQWPSSSRVNAVRTSHYPQSHAFIEECDRRGILVFTEIPGWQYVSSSQHWRDICIQNVEEMVRQYRNHPSIFMWGVRVNESQDDDALYTKTNALAHSLDPTRPTSGVRYLEKSSLLEDIYSYNDFSHNGTNPGCRKK